MYFERLEVAEGTRRIESDGRVAEGSQPYVRYEKGTKAVGVSEPPVRELQWVSEFAEKEQTNVRNSGLALPPSWWT